MQYPKRALILIPVLFLSAWAESGWAAEQAQDPATQEQKQEAEKSDKKAAKQKKRAQQRAARRAEQGDEQPDEASGAPSSGTVEIVSDRQSEDGDIFVAEGYVNATMGEMRLQADRATFNRATGDMVADGNVIFDQGPDQRVTARRAEINWNSQKGTFWDTTGFTNRTQTGDYIYFTADRTVKTGPDTYDLFGAVVTACQDAIPKWTFSAPRAEVKMGDRVKLYNTVFRVKQVPAFVLPFAWIPATRNERKSGFLLPTTGNSNQKGRQLKVAYYQTLGSSADVTFRWDLYTQRGIGLGAEFRAQTDDESYMRLGVYTVKDRLFGPPGDDQGGTAFVGQGVQHLPHGWLAVGDISLVSSLPFRQVFSDDISQVIDPRTESTFYANNNTGNFSVNFVASAETTRVLRPSADPVVSQSVGTDFDIKIRQAPEFDMSAYPRRLLDKLPIYFSFDSSIGALKREERVSDTTVESTPAAVQRFDFQPKIIAPLATFGGIAITPSLSFRETFYSNSFNPDVPTFNPDLFALVQNDPRLDPASPLFQPGVKLFDLNSQDPIGSENISRHYAELSVDIRPPSLVKDYVNDDGSGKFRHLIEPYITYRLISGIGDEFDRIIRFDDRDAVANTNEFEYAVVNRFFVNTHPSELKRKRSGRKNALPSEMKPSVPSGGETRPSPQPAGKEDQAEKSGDKKKLEAGKQAELNTGQGRDQTGDQQKKGKRGAVQESYDYEDSATNEDTPVQPYEFLTVKVAQKYFFDRNFGGALVEGIRNQFYPINTMSGYTFGGRARSFSPVNVAVRYRPLSSVYADIRMDVGSDDGAVRDVTVSGGFKTNKFLVSSSWHLSRRIELTPNSFEPGTFPGNQVLTTVQMGDGYRGFYAGLRVGYDFTDRVIDPVTVSRGRLRNSRSYVGYSWDCCGLQFNYNTFKAGLRNESAFSFTFSLAGLGSYGTDQFSQLSGGGTRRRSRGLRNAPDDY